MSSEVEKEGEGFQEVSRDNGGNGRNYQESEKIGLKPGETFCLCVSPGSNPVSQFTSTVPIHPSQWVWEARQRAQEASLGVGKPAKKPGR